MLCEKCKRNEANIYITKIVNGEKQRKALCDKCAKEMQVLDFNGDLEMNNPFYIKDVLGGILDLIGNNPNYINNLKQDLICKNCGTSYDEFKKSGLLGCDECYVNFDEALNNVIKRVQQNTEHIGKIPVSKGKEISIKRQINKLKEQLQKVIALEEYERAAEIRDEIRKLQNQK